jgi:hypothetical protein
MSVNANGTDSGTIALVQQAFDTARQTTVIQNQHPVEVGTPVHPDIRQVTPPEQMGAGYRPASESDPR